MFACLWVYVGKFSGEPITWIKQKNAYYFATVTMVTVGYGDITPQNSFEMFVCIISVLIACGIFAYSLSSIGVIFQELYEEQKKFQQKLFILNNYMEEKKVSFSLQYQIREYLEYYCKENNQNNQEKESKIISQLSDNLKQSLLIEANKIILQNNTVFKKYFSQKLLFKIVNIIHEKRCTPEQIIYTQGQKDDCEIYFIYSGTVEVYVETPQKKKIQIKILKQGDSFGENNFFTQINRSYCIRSFEFTKLLYIKRDDFLDLIKDFPDDYEMFCMIKEYINHNSQERVNKKCYSCGNSFMHTSFDCPFFQSYDSIDKIDNFHDKFELQNEFNMSKDEKKQAFKYSLEDFEKLKRFNRFFIKYNYENQYKVSQSQKFSNSSSLKNYYTKGFSKYWRYEGLKIIQKLQNLQEQ
ncbi:hypothetical protein IMG5_010550 [Ichthyophthirius multifiliis]|uniref:Cyclic nucleotide-binding domain-containing protein n=1 Tax=Ichthyophthirius multifiliis TaxID=5932 RepID=G0QJY6_ICHMU|nr:hypothetical protein IMG5_010550 [Ichthyophthirius multifiliis]EGR34467.1 hypothetical protein IMG5_010550 [Ichthyophthirius multifiliis]|eukprot:XP_004039771.1 hypothetical protein IMG5_010550 [Ichthyophthirius multifiliis]